MLGYQLNGEGVLVRCPPYDFKAQNPRQPKLEDHKFSDHALAHLEDVRADPWDSQNPGEAVPRRTVLPELVTTSDPVTLISLFILFRLWFCGLSWSRF